MTNFVLQKDGPNCTFSKLGFPGGLDGEDSACNAGDTSSVPGLERSPGEGNGNPFQYSCLENSMNRGAWQATALGSERVGHNWATNTQTSLLLFHIVVPLPVSINWPDSSNMSGVYFSDLGTYRSPGILLNEDFNLGGLWWDLRVCIFNRFPGNTDLCWSWTTRS